MQALLGMLLVLVVCVAGAVGHAVVLKTRRARFIRRYAWPPGLDERLRQKRPELSTRARQRVANGLRQFFLAYLDGDRRFVAMPSQAADDLWHEFILYTRHYQTFCQKAFGGFLHHAPAAVLGPAAARANNAGLRRVWWFACRHEGLDPRRPGRLPLLFALDTDLNIADGFRYVVDCHGLTRTDAKAPAGVVHCGSDFASPAFDGGTDGFGDSGSHGHGAGHDGGGGHDGSGGDAGCGGHGGCGD